MAAIPLTYVSVLIMVALALLVTGLLLVVAVILSRVIKTRRKIQHEGLRDEFQKTVNALIILDNTRGNLNRFSLSFYLKELQGKIRTPLRKQVLIDLLVANKQNLRGDSSTMLRKVYIRLRLKKFSAAKLRKAGRIKIIKGLQELAEMECYDQLPAAQELFTHNDALVRQESFIAIVRLASSSPFVLVDDYLGIITPWMQLTIHKHLTRIPPEKLPEFWKWFYSSNCEIQKFAMNMTLQFRQLDAAPHLARLLNEPHIELAAIAAEVLGEFGLPGHTQAVVNLGNRNATNETVSLKVIHALGQIGDGEQHGEYLAWQMIHGTYAARIEAMRVMQKLNLNCRDFLVDFGGANDETLQNIHAHINHSLLRK